MKKVLIVTYIDFWKGGAGCHSRLTSIVNFLRGRCNLTVLFIGPADTTDLQILQKDYSWLKMDYLEIRYRLDWSAYVERFAEYMSRNYFDIALLEYIEMYLILHLFPRDTIKILDTHDVLSEKIKSFSKYNIPYNGMMMTLEQEIKIYSEFDHVILINYDDQAKVKDKMSRDNTMVVPHPINFPKRIINQKVSNVLFMASAYPPNVEGITWFLENVWPFVDNDHIQLNIYGKVADALVDKIGIYKNVNFIGFVENIESVYQKTDLVINPTRAGAGLKIKNVEALGNGLPLITTSHGLSGMEDALPNALAAADTAEEFIKVFNELLNDYPRRKAMGEHAFNYAHAKFSETACFRPLLNLL